MPYITRGLMLGAVYHFINVSAAAAMMSNMWEMSILFIRKISVICSLGKMEGMNSGKYLGRCVRSLAPIRVAVGEFYYMEHDAKLTLMSFLVAGTGTVLVTFK